MAITLPAPATREEVKRALDVNYTARSDAQVDRAIEAARDSVEGLLHRRFYVADETNKWDWPNFQRAYPWRIWFDEKELADVTVNVPVVTSGGNLIPASAILWGPWNYAPPFRWLELDRSQSFSFGQGSTPQQDVHIAGTYGYWIKTAPAGLLAASISSTSATAIQVSNSAALGTGDELVVDSERMLITDRAMITTSQTQQGSGVSTASMADQALAVTTGSAYNVSEVLLLDSERMLITDIAGNSLTVKRAYDGTTLATHSGATIYAPRQLTVTRGDFGTTAATHSSSAPLAIYVVPALVKELGVAESLVYLGQEIKGYAGASAAMSAPTGQQKEPVPGPGLPDLRDRCYARHGRQMRQRVV